MKTVKRVSLIAIETLGFLLVSHSSSLGADDAVSAATPPPGYQLVWADEFSKDPDGLPDPTKWIYEEGFIRNHEAQYYTKERKENARVENGQLIIEARRENFPNPSSKGPPMAGYTSAALETRGKADWLYGRIEVRAKLPAGKGVWPGIWMLGSDENQPGIGWPKCGEIDIMELVGKQPGVIHGSIHYFRGGKKVTETKELHVAHPEADFHVYAAEWTPDRIDIFVDGTKYNTFAVSKADNDGQNPFRKPQFLLLDLALGGGLGGEIEDSILPQRMVVDYVRIYQKSAGYP